MQEALLAAARQWPDEGVPDNPRGWLVTVASRRLVDRWRSDRARAERELARRADAAGRPAPGRRPRRLADAAAALLPPGADPALAGGADAAGGGRAEHRPDRPGLPGARGDDGAADQPGQGAAPRGRRGASAPRRRTRCPAGWPRSPRCSTSSSPRGTPRTTGGGLTDPSLAAEAIRLTRLLHGHLPSAGEVTGLLALMLLTDARRAARTRADGSLVPAGRAGPVRCGTATSSRRASGWSRRPCPPGRSAPTSCRRRSRRSMPRRRTRRRRTGRRSSCSTGCCTSRRPGPAVTLNHAVAVAEVRGPAEALAMVEPLLADRKLRHDHRPHAVHAHLLERLGRRDEAGRGVRRRRPAGHQHPRAAAPQRSGRRGPGRRPAVTRCSCR